VKRQIAILASALILAVAPQTHAQSAPPPAQGEVAAQLVLDADLIEGVDREALRDAIAEELGVKIALAGPGVEGRGTLRVRLESPGHVTISFRAEGGKEVGRSLELPKKPELAVEMIALIVGNLVRNEAAELLESLKPKPKPVAAPPPPPPPPVPVVTAPSPRPVGVCGRATAWVGLDAVPGVGWHRDETRRLSLGLLGTYSRGVRGAELGPVAAITNGHVCGAQVGGAVAIATGAVHGVQIGGAVAVAWGGLDGVMIAPVNVASKVSGVQLGVVNVATGDVRGVQLGVVNVARDADAPIGLLNIMTHGRTHLDVWGNETGLGMLELLHGGRRVHNLYGVGARLGPRGFRPAIMLGLGVRAFSSPALTVDVDASVTQLRRDVSHATLVSQLRAVLGVRIVDDLAVMVGPTWSVMWTDDPEESPQASVGVVELPENMYGWPGVVLGLRGF